MFISKRKQQGTTSTISVEHSGPKSSHNGSVGKTNFTPKVAKMKKTSNIAKKNSTQKWLSSQQTAHKQPTKIPKSVKMVESSNNLGTVKQKKSYDQHIDNKVDQTWQTPKKANNTVERTKRIMTDKNKSSFIISSAQKKSTLHEQAWKKVQINQQTSQNKKSAYVEVSQQNSKEISDAGSNLTQNKKTVPFLELKCKVLQKQTQNLKQENDALRKEIEQQKLEMIKMQKFLGKQKLENHNLRLEIEKSKSIHADNRVIIEQLQPLLGKANQENAALKQRINHLEQQYVKYQKIFRIMKDKEISEVLEVFDCYEQQLTSHHNKCLVNNPDREDVIQNLRERCSILEDICDEIVDKEKGRNPAEALVEIGMRVIGYWDSFKKDNSISISESNNNEFQILTASILNRSQ